MRNRLLSVLKFRPRHTVAVMVAVGMVVVPAVTALAFYGATGTGNVTGVSAGSTTSSTVNLDQQVSPTVLNPGDSTQIGLAARCLTGCPAYVTTVRLQSWSSDKAGCTEAAMPGSFSMPTVLVNMSVTSTPTGLGAGTLTWNNLAVDQSPCKSASFTFVLTTP